MIAVLSIAVGVLLPLCLFLVWVAWEFSSEVTDLEEGNDKLASEVQRLWAVCHELKGQLECAVSAEERLCECRRK